jgi:hypothetical protein
MLDAAGALARAAEICRDHGFGWHPSGAKAVLTEAQESARVWIVRDGPETDDWLEQEIDGGGRVLHIDASSGVFLGLDTGRSFIAAAQLRARPQRT